MDDGKLIVDELETLLRSVEQSAPPPDAYNAEIRPLLSRLRTLAVGRSGEIYIIEKIDAFDWSMKAILGLNNGNGHSMSKHVAWASTALNTLRDLDIGAVPEPPE